MQRTRKAGPGRPFTPNRMEREGALTKIFLNQGQIALADTRFVETLRLFHWCYHSSGYVHARIGCSGRFIYLHVLVAFLAGKGPWAEVDHFNRKPLDNRSDNLRAADHSLNMLNRDPWSVPFLPSPTTDLLARTERSVFECLLFRYLIDEKDLSPDLARVRAKAIAEAWHG